MFVVVLPIFRDPVGGFTADIDPVSARDWEGSLVFGLSPDFANTRLTHIASYPLPLPFGMEALVLTEAGSIVMSGIECECGASL